MTSLGGLWSILCNFYDAQGSVVSCCILSFYACHLLNKGKMWKTKVNVTGKREDTSTCYIVALERLVCHTYAPVVIIGCVCCTCHWLVCRWPCVECHCVVKSAIAINIWGEDCNDGVFFFFYCLLLSQLPAIGLRVWTNQWFSLIRTDTTSFGRTKLWSFGLRPLPHLLFRLWLVR